MGWGDVRYYFAMAILVILIILLSSALFSSASILSGTFLGDALIKLYETLKEYHMPCEVVLLRVIFFKMVAVAMETAKMLKN
jgi:hypothetical protein